MVRIGGRSSRLGWACGVCAAAVLGAAAPAFAEVVIHVAPPGGGVDASPLLRQALAGAREARQSHAGEAVVVEFAPGAYHLAQTLSILGEDSGASGAPLVLRAAPGGGTVRLLGSMALTQRAEPSEAARSRSPAGGRLLAFDLDPAARQRLVNEKAKSSQHSETGVALLLVQGETMLHAARWPRQGYAVAQATGGAGGQGPMFSAGQARRWAGEPDLWAGGFFNQAWNYETARVTNVDGDGAVQVAALQTRYPILPSFRYFIYNALSELDAPGQYVGDPQSGQIDVIPAADPERLPIESTVVPTVIRIVGAHDVTLQGLEVANALSAAVLIDGSSRVTLDGCFVTRSGAAGVKITGGAGNLVQHTVISDTGEEGVILSGGDRQTLGPAHHQVLDSILVRTGQEIRAYRPAVRLEGVGNVVAGSVLADAPHSAVMFDGNEHRIQRNEIFHVVTETDDAAAIYTDRDPAARGTVMTENYFHDIVDTYSGPNHQGVYGVYFDDYNSGLTVTKNLFLRTATGVFIHGGSDNVVTQNLFIGVRSPAIRFVDMAGSYATTVANLQANMKRAPFDGPLYRQRYPALGKELTAGLQTARDNRIGPNLVTGDTQAISFTPGQAGALQSVTPALQRPLGGGANDPVSAAAAVGGDPFGLPLPSMDRRRALADLPFIGAAQASLH